MGNQHTKKQDETLQAQVDALAAKRAAEEAAALAVRTLVRIRVYRLDNTIDEIVQTLPRMKKGETITFTVTPENE
jgi:hypothetical protein